MRRIGKWLAGLLPLAAAGAGLYYFYVARGEKGPTYETEKVTRGSIEAHLVASGSLSPLVTVQVGSQVSGRIQKLFVDFNSKVKKGEVIAKIDPQLFKAAVSQARANRMVAEAALAKAKIQAVDADRQLGRSRDLAARKLLAQADLDTAQVNADAAKTQILSAQASLAQAEAAQRQAEINLAYTTIYSPIDGVVISRNVDVGQTVAASLQAPTLFSIAEDLSKMQVHANVSEADIGRVREKMPTTFTVDAYPKEPFSGVVREVRNSPQTVQNVVTYDVVIDVANENLRLKPGMTASVTFVYARAKDVLLVPNAALRFKAPAELAGAATRPKRRQAGGGAGSDGPPGGAKTKVASPEAGSASKLDRGGAAEIGKGPRAGKRADRRTVWKLENGAPRRVRISVGISDGTNTSVLEGDLAEGDQLITEASGLEKSGPSRPSPPGMPRPPGGGGGRGRFIRHL